MRNKIKKRIIAVSVLTFVAIIASIAYSHCQIPCGIYDDEGRFDAISEHITTIEKSMKEIERLSAEAKPNMNQIVRWVNNKELHADELSEIVTYYFMAQRVKLPVDNDAKAYDDYIKKLTRLHRMLVYAMKAKQTTDLANVQELRSLLDKFHKIYSGSTG